MLLGPPDLPPGRAQEQPGQTSAAGLMQQGRAPHLELVDEELGVLANLGGVHAAAELCRRVRTLACVLVDSA